jgi:GT2 family glycosyltransferase
MVSVTIVTWNSEKYLADCFAALAAQDYRDFEVVIVDNDSKDGTRAILKTVNPSWRVILNEKNVGFAAGQNQAIGASTGNEVLCLNPDVILSTNFITQLMAAAGESCFDAGVFCGKLLRWDPAAQKVEQPFRVASSVDEENGREASSANSSPDPKPGSNAGRGPEGPLYPNSNSTPEGMPVPKRSRLQEFASETDSHKTNIIDSTGIYFTPNMRHLDRGAEEVDHGQYDRLQYVFGASGAAAFFRRSFIDDVSVEDQFFDEEFFAFREDGDLAWRAQVLGWKCLYVPTAVAWHVRRVTPERRKDLPLIINWHSAKNRFLMRGKNASGWLCWRLFFPVFWRDMMTCGYAALRDRRLLSAVTYWWRERESVRRKRRIIQSRRRVSDHELVWWFSNTPRAKDAPEPPPHSALSSQQSAKQK